MVAIKNILLLAATAAAAVLPRDGVSILRNLRQLNANTGNLINSAKQFDGGYLNAYQIATANSALSNQIKTTTNDVARSARLESDEAGALMTYIRDTLVPSISTAVAVLQQKKPVVASSGFQGDVKDAISSLRRDTARLSQTLVNKVPAEQAAELQGAMSPVDTAFQAAVNTFSS